MADSVLVPRQFDFEHGITQITTASPVWRLIELATNGLEENTRKAYSHHLENFLAWLAADRGGTFNREFVLAYKQHLMDQDYAPATVNQALTTIRRLAEEGKWQGLNPVVADGIIAIKNVARAGRRLGTWLSPQQMTLLFECTDRYALKGHQQRIIIALLAGCALRRSEAAGLTFDRIQQREDTWLIVDLKGKGNKTRSMPVSPWVMRHLTAWKEQAKIEDGLVLRAVNKSDKLTGQVTTRAGRLSTGGMSVKAIYHNIKAVADLCGIDNLGPHDLRRTWARRAFKQGFPLDQIQIILGHASLMTTQKYIGLTGLDLESPVYVTY